MGLFDRRRRETSYQGFSKYAQDINTYHHPTQHAGLPIVPSSQQRTQSLTNAGQAAVAALRLHSSPVSQSPAAAAAAAAAAAKGQAKAGAVPRSNSLSMASSARSNSLRQYTYHPQASYTPNTRNAPVARRSNSLTLQSRNSLTRSSQLARQKYQQQNNLQEETNEDLEEEDYVVTTTTTKVVDSQGRTSSITTKTIKTFPDGSNIIETSTKNISRNNSRANSLSSANYNRTNSMSHQIPVKLSQIDEDLQNFDYDYQVDDVPPANLRLNTDDSSQGFTTLEKIHEPVSVESEAKDNARLGEPFDEPQPQPHSRPSQKRASSLTSQNQPPKSILKHSVVAPEAQQDNQAQVHSPTVQSPTAAAAAAAALTSPKPMSSATPSPQQQQQQQQQHYQHPYKNLSQGTSVQQQQPQQQPVRTLRSPTSPTSKPSIGSPLKSPSVQNGFAEDAHSGPNSFASPRQNIPKSQSSGSSIKFDDHVETIPVPVNRSNVHSPQKPYVPGNRSKAPPKASSSTQPSADFYAAAMQAAYKKVYGDRDPSQISASPPPVGASPREPAAPLQEQVSSAEALPEKRKFGFIPLSPRKDTTIQPAAPELEQLAIPSTERTSSLNSLSKKRAQQAEADQSLPQNYEYANHHKDFALYSMRDEPIVASKRKERAKEEQRLAREQAKEEQRRAKVEAKEHAEREKRLAKEREEEEKRLEKERAEEEKRIRKEAKKKDRKGFGGLFGKRRRQSQSGVSIDSSENGVGKTAQNTQTPITGGTAANQVPVAPAAGTAAPAAAPVAQPYTPPEQLTILREAAPVVTNAAAPQSSENGVGASGAARPQTLQNPTNLTENVGTVEGYKRDLTQPTVDPKQADLQSGSTQPVQAAAPASAPSHAPAPAPAPVSPNVETEEDIAAVVLDDGELYRISVPRNYSYEDREAEASEKPAAGIQTHSPSATLNKNGPAHTPKATAPHPQEYYPSPNISNKARYSAYEPNSSPVEQSSNVAGGYASNGLGKISVPQLNDIEDEDLEEPSFKSYENLATPKVQSLDNDREDMIDEGVVVLDEVPMRSAARVDDVPVRSPARIDESGYLDAPTNFASAIDIPVRSPSRRKAAASQSQEPALESEVANARQNPVLAGESTAPVKNDEVKASAFVKETTPLGGAGANPNLVGSQFITNKASTGTIGGLPYSEQTNNHPNNLKKEPAVTNQNPTRSSPVAQQTQPQEGFVLVEDAERDSNSAQPSADTLPTTQSTYIVDQQQRKPYDDVVTEEGKEAKKGKKVKKEKKPGSFKHKMMKFFVNNYDA
ncbi:uncharacterized protein LODBEIA_P57770 [Lodderomyces beijingensis]|uniref:Uncharacterized protein n=1 Tax=Lodderomyces beijingensis TaxID=1775926 RepID=A0ABP0ZV33_9ASCO